MARETDAPPPRPQPQRPQMSNLTPAPVRPQVPPSGAVVASRSLWLLSFVLGFATVTMSFLTRDTHIEQLKAVVAEVAPDQGADAMQTASVFTFWASFAALAIVLFVQVLLLGALMRGKGGVRWGQLISVLAQAGVVLVADAFLGLGEYGVIFTGLLLGQLLLTGVALLVSLLPSASAWLRNQRSSRPQASS